MYLFIMYFETCNGYRGVVGREVSQDVHFLSPSSKELFASTIPNTRSERFDSPKQEATTRCVWKYLYQVPGTGFPCAFKITCGLKKLLPFRDFCADPCLVKTPPYSPENRMYVIRGGKQV